MTKPLFSSFWSRSPDTSSSASSSVDSGVDGITSAERAALTELQTAIANERTALASSLGDTDGLGVALRDGDRVLEDALLRLLRYNGCAVTRAHAQLKATVAWRVRSSISKIPAHAMRGRAAGIPIAVVPVQGRHRVTLSYTGARHYCRRDVDSKKHARAVARLFDELLYVSDGALSTGTVGVVDFDALSLSNVDIVTTRADVALFLGHYPEAFARLLFVSYPRFVYHCTFLLAASILIFAY